MPNENASLDTIVCAAVEIALVEARAAFIVQACGADADLRSRAERLVDAHFRAAGFLDKPVPERLVEELAGPATVAEVQDDIPAGGPSDEDLGFLTPSDKPDSLGRLGHYEIQEVIGRGGMGIVLKAFDEQLHRVVAIKVMAAPLASNATARKRFTREAQAAAAVTHDHIVTIHAVAGNSPQPYLVMHYVAGLSLQQRLDRDGPLELQEILRIGMQTAKALTAAHAQGLVHRDIKPANILLENGVERVKITDFGLARAANEASLTQSGVVAGTPQYMSPEQAEGKAIDPRTDLFCLGSVLYAMCTGRAPFRASGTMAVLKRVCEEAPTPIRESNVDIPEWLVEIIAKLHAKDPAERYQSAAEVAELLGRQLAHVQHPSIVGPAAPKVSEPKATSRPAPRRRPAVAAVVFLCLFAGLAFTEATGVTNVRGTVIRIFTPDGTLVVEVDDPSVKVTVEGDGGLVITGAGLEEIRLRPGNYKVWAEREGKKVLLDRELVSIAKGGREIVKVKLEAPPAPVAAKAEQGAFVLLAPGKERKFDTLADAVQGASDGDTIEIRGNGPFVLEPMPIKIKFALTIRAGDGFRPVMNLTVAPVTHPKSNFWYGLETVAPLVLEGLEFRLLVPEKNDVSYAFVMASTSLRVANCRFHANGGYCLFGFGPSSPSCVWNVRNCLFLCTNETRVVAKGLFSGHTLILDNSVATTPCLISGVTPDAKEPSVRLTRNTFRAYPCAVEFVGPTDRAPDRDDAKKGNNVLLVEASGNLFDTPYVLVFSQHQSGKILSPADGQKYLAQVVGWKGERNLYSVAGQYLILWSIEKGSQDLAKPIKTFGDWKQFWPTAEDNSIEGVVRYQGGDLLAKVKLSPEKVTPEDFRLHPDSAGHKAGKDGKDLGADVDLVGPGPAYERWKKTPEYQQWLKETAHLKKPETPKAEAQAFVLLAAGKERRFDTLADAAQGAAGGDTIEIRGNGPFVTKPINLGKTALTIRAGEGFRPVIKLSPEGLQAQAPLLETEAALVLEGLELQRMAEERKEGPPWQVVLLTSKDLHVANCRFLMRKTAFCIVTDSPVSELRNCEFLCADHGNAVACLNLHQSGQRLVIDNCLLTDVARVNSHERHKPEEAFVQLTRNTFRTRPNGVFWFYQALDKAPSPKHLDRGAKLLRIETSGNIFDAVCVFRVEQDPPDKRLPTDETESHLARKVGWVGERNLYAVDVPFLRLDTTFKPTRSVKNLVDWKQFWTTAEDNSIEGLVRYQGGDLLAERVATPEQLTPEDFRLRPDSAGYKAGKDGKDLGADVDLVGPGPAYERWKKTPDYQQWFKDTGQVTKAEATKPVLRMHFDKADFYEKDGKTYARDHSGKGNDGLCEQVQFTPDGKTGGGLANAGKGFLRLPTSLVAGRSHFTIAAWVKCTNPADSWSVYSCLPKDYPTRELPAFNIFCTNGLHVGAWDWDWLHASALDAKISPGEWVFVAVTLENGAPGKGRLQLILNDRFAVKSLQQIGGGPLEEIQDIAALKLEGVFDELTVWQRALTEQELREVFAKDQSGSKK